MSIFKAGDILVSSWGYDQTNIDFYLVTRATEKTVWLNQLESNKINDGPMSMTGKATPAYKNGKPVLRLNRDTIKRRIKFNLVRITDYKSAFLWDGEAMRYSSYA